MYLKVTDGIVTHFVQIDRDVQYHEVLSMEPEELAHFQEEGHTEFQYFVTTDEDDRAEMEKRGVVIRPEGLPLRTIVTNWDVYLLSSTGKTLEVINRIPD